VGQFLMLGGGQFLMPVLTYGFNAGALLTQGGVGQFLMPASGSLSHAGSQD
jgi:hypothetical protein